MKLPPASSGIQVPIMVSIKVSNNHSCHFYLATPSGSGENRDAVFLQKNLTEREGGREKKKHSPLFLHCQIWR